MTLNEAAAIPRRDAMKTLPALPHQRRVPGASKRLPLTVPPHIAGSLPGLCVDCKAGK